MESREVIVIEARRTDYSVEQVLENRDTLTVGGLREILEMYDDETPIMLSHDGGYTFGPISGNDIDTRYTESDEEDEE
jgi:hypothetical protein